MTRAVLIAAVALLALGGCGGSSENADEALRDTAAKLGEIRSGTLDLRFVVIPRAAEDEEFGFELHGPFELGGDGNLPKLEVEYVQIANGQRGAVKIISTGERAYADVGGEVQELTVAQTDQLRSASSELESEGGLGALPLDDWIVEPEASDGDAVGDADTTKVEGELEIVAAANGLIDLVRGFGRDVTRLEGASADQLREATESTRFVLLTGKEDKLLRELILEAVFGLDVPEDLRDALGDVVGATVSFEVRITDPNKPITVEDPTQ